MKTLSKQAQEVVTIDENMTVMVEQLKLIRDGRAGDLQVKKYKDAVEALVNILGREGFNDRISEIIEMTRQ